MASGGTSSTKLQKTSPGFTVALASAVFEWLLMLFLFVDALFSYVLTRFARYCDLQTPCLLCSRLDHVFGNQQHGFYWDLICRNHKLEISSLVLCHCHNKLVDVHGICESCLFSFATVNKSNAETYRLLVGKLGEEPHVRLCDSRKKHCSCCKEPWVSTVYKETSDQGKPVGFNTSDFDLPLSSSALRDYAALKKETEISSTTGSASRLKNHGLDLLSHFGYTELKITSDTESDVPLSDDDDRNSVVCDTGGIIKDFGIKDLLVKPRDIDLPGGLISEVPINLPPIKPETSSVVSDIESVVIDPNSRIPVAPAVAGTGLEELWQQTEPKTESSSLAELISPEPPSTAKDAASEVIRQSNVLGGELGQSRASESGEMCKAGSRSLTARDMTRGPGPHKSNSLDLGEAYKLAVGNRGRQLSGLLSEQWSAKDSAEFNEDLKLLLTQISASRGIELPKSETSPRVPLKSDGLKSFDASGSSGVQMLQKRVSLERNESGFESLDGSIVGEIEGESLVDRFKRQVEHDRKCLGALYKELDEERNASAVAASQAMAMINRLQEEKAALHMEALQYLRLMEEQAEYDMEAVQTANDLLTEKEKEMQDLEEELEFYRQNFQNGLDIAASEMKPGDVRGVQQTGRGYAEGNVDSHSDSVVEKPFVCGKEEEPDMLTGTTDDDTVRNSLSEFDEERLYILQCLKKLENRLQMFPNGEIYLELPNGEHCESNGDGRGTLRELYSNESDIHDVGQEKEVSVNVQDGHVPPSQGNQSFGTEITDLRSKKEDSTNTVASRVKDLVNVSNEVSDLRNRLKALEANHNFLEKTINSLRIGDEGLKFVQDIVRNLQDLRAGRRTDLTVT